MAVAIIPTVAAANAAAKPYAVTLSAQIDFAPFDFVWTIDGIPTYAGFGGSGTLPGPAIVFDAKPKVVRVDIRRQVDSVIESDTYTTADQRPAPSISVSLLDQKNGVPITNSITRPTAPTVSPVTGETQLSLVWSYGAPGQPSQSDIIVRVQAADEADQIDRVRINWGDGEIDNVDCAGVAGTVFDRPHTYASTTGNVVVTATVFNALGAPNPPGTLGVTIPTDATGWRANQYRITQYQDQLGFKDIDVVGWRSISDDVLSFTLYSMRRRHTYYYQLQLRETDTTGRPVSTSLRSNPSSVGPW